MIDQEPNIYNQPAITEFAVKESFRHVRQLAALEELQKLYDSLPEIKCKRKCQECCGPIGMSLAEAFNIEQNSGRHELPMVTEAAVCTALTPEGNCAIYSVRPLICRLYGLVKAMRCPHGCKPKRWVGSDEAKRLFEAVNRISESGESVFTHPALGAAIKAMKAGISL